MSGDAVTLAIGSARVVLARTSVPPCFSVMPMPMVIPDLSLQDRNSGSYWREPILGMTRASSEGAAASAATAARVMVTGHMCPFSTCATM